MTPAAPDSRDVLTIPTTATPDCRNNSTESATVPTLPNISEPNSTESIRAVLRSALSEISPRVGKDIHNQRQLSKDNYAELVEIHGVELTLRMQLRTFLQ